MNENGRGAHGRRGRNKQFGRGEQKPEKPQAKGRNADVPAEGSKKNRQRGEQQKKSFGSNEKNKAQAGRVRPKWKPPELLTDPIPKPECPVCGKPIEDLASAINDKPSGEAAHFDCVRGKIASGEAIEKGESLTYIGGGRFGIVDFEGPDKRYFKIKKIIECEGAELRADWRVNIADHFSIT
jgi:hypothetical protein